MVAREYGLPCLVGAEAATELFQDGEMLCLDATRGVVFRAEETAGEQGEKSVMKS